MEENILLSNDKVFSIINKSMNVEACLKDISDKDFAQKRFDELVNLMQENNFYILFAECIELEECIVSSIIFKNKNDNKEIELKLFYSLCNNINSSIHFFMNIDDSISIFKNDIEFENYIKSDAINNIEFEMYQTKYNFEKRIDEIIDLLEKNEIKNTSGDYCLFSKHMCFTKNDKIFAYITIDTSNLNDYYLMFEKVSEFN